MLAYEIARSDGEITENELNVMMEEIEKIAKKVEKDKSEIFKIVEIYSSDSVFSWIYRRYKSSYLKDDKLQLMNSYGKQHSQMDDLM